MFPTDPRLSRKILERLKLRGCALLGCVAVLMSAELGAQTLYSIGSPTDEEQLFVELVNRAREDADAEALRLANTTDTDILAAISQFEVDLDLMIDQFGTLDSSLPPLALNSDLQDMAYGHALDQFENVFQSHTGSDGSTIATRADAAGYFWTLIGENTFSYAESVEYGHAGFQIDWGNGVGGMQDPPGHRLNIHSSEYREIGVGVVLGTNGTRPNEVGPIIVVQNFGTQFNAVPFLTGVVFDDADGDNFYDAGEGIGGVEIRVDGNDYYAVTAESGGYSIPLSSGQDGSYSVSVEGSDFSTSTTITVQNSENVKLDIIPSEIQESVSTFVAGLFPQATPVSEGWDYDSAFGLFYTDSEPWIYHQSLEWVYAQSGDASGEMFLYSTEHGWFWTTSSAFPYLYHAESGAWYYYSTNDAGDRWLYDFAGGAWIAWDSFGSTE
ncbi:MAG: CAP domain-containing protein [Opitutales bacterium]